MSATAQHPGRDALPACPAIGNPNRLVSLWLVMQRFHADMCCGIVAAIVKGEQVVSTSPSGSPIPDAWIEQAKTGLLLGIKLLAVDAGLTETADLADRIFNGLNAPVSVEKFRYSFLHLRELMESEMRKQLFLTVPAALAGFYENDKPLGDLVYANFPSARLDLTEAGSCLACGRNNAAMHHLMLAAEIGLRELGKDRQIPFAVSGTIEFKQWGEIIGQIEEAVKKIQQWPNSEGKEEAHRFYNAVLPELRSFNDGFRRHLAHARTHKFTPTEALALWDHVSRFFKTLSLRISETSHTPLIWTGLPCQP